MRLKKEREARIAAEHNQRVLEQKLMVIEQEQQASKKGIRSWHVAAASITLCTFVCKISLLYMKPRALLPCGVS